MEHEYPHEQSTGFQEYQEKVLILNSLKKWQLIRRARASWEVFKAANQPIYHTTGPERSAPPRREKYPLQLRAEADLNDARQRAAAEAHNTIISD